MALRKIFFYLGFLSLISPVCAQSGNRAARMDGMDLIRSDVFFIQNQHERYANIEGSPYLNEAFSKGSISLGLTHVENVDLRYNIYEDQFEILDDEVIKLIDPKNNQADTVWLKDDTYLYVSLEVGKKIKMTFMKMVYGEGTRVLLKHKMILTESEQSVGYKEAIPARFNRQQDLIFIQLPGSHAKEFKGKKTLEELFPEHHHQLSEYAKSEKLKLKKVDDITKLCVYFDSLIASDINGS